MTKQLIDRYEVIKYIESISHPCQIPEIVKKINNLPIESQWIPRNEKLPNKGRYVLLKMSDEGNYYVNSFISEIGNGWGTNRHGNTTRIENIEFTHSMELSHLPLPPITK